MAGPKTSPKPSTSQAARSPEQTPFRAGPSTPLLTSPLSSTGSTQEGQSRKRSPKNGGKCTSENPRSLTIRLLEKPGKVADSSPGKAPNPSRDAHSRRPWITTPRQHGSRWREVTNPPVQPPARGKKRRPQAGPPDPPEVLLQRHPLSPRAEEWRALIAARVTADVRTALTEALGKEAHHAGSVGLLDDSSTSSTHSEQSLGSTSTSSNASPRTSVDSGATLCTKSRKRTLRRRKGRQRARAERVARSERERLTTLRKATSIEKLDIIGYKQAEARKLAQAILFAPSAPPMELVASHALDLAVHDSQSIASARAAKDPLVFNEGAHRNGFCPVYAVPKTDFVAPKVSGRWEDWFGTAIPNPVAGKSQLNPNARSWEPKNTQTLPRGTAHLSALFPTHSAKESTLPDPSVLAKKIKKKAPAKPTQKPTPVSVVTATPAPSNAGTPPVPPGNPAAAVNSGQVAAPTGTVRKLPVANGPSLQLNKLMGAECRQPEDPIKTRTHAPVPPKKRGLAKKQAKTREVIDIELYGYLIYEFAFRPRNHITMAEMATKGKRWLATFDVSEWTHSQLHEMLCSAVTKAMAVPHAEQAARQECKAIAADPDTLKHSKWVTTGNAGATRSLASFGARVEHHLPSPP